MKTWLIACLIFTSTFANSDYVIYESDNIDRYTISVAYAYPIVPGTDEWAGLRSFQKMMDATQVPRIIVENMTTEALVETVLTWPMFPQPFTYNEPSKILSEYIEMGYSKPLNELLEREDAPAIVMQKYSGYEIPARVEYSESEVSIPLEELNYYLRLNNLEMLLSNREFLNNFSSPQKEQLVELVFEKIEERALQGRYTWLRLPFFGSLDMADDEIFEHFGIEMQNWK